MLQKSESFVPDKAEFDWKMTSQKEENYTNSNEPLRQDSCLPLHAKMEADGASGGSEGR